MAVVLPVAREPELLLNITLPKRALRDAAIGGPVSGLRRDLRIIRLCGLILVLLAAITASVAGADLLAPTAIAVTLALVLAPVTRALEKIGLPTGVASVVTVVATVSFISAGAVALAPEASNWLSQAPQIAQSIERKLRPIARQIAAVERASNQLAQTESGGAARSVQVAGDSMLMAVARRAPSIVEKGVYITVLMIFLLAYRRRYTRQLILFPRAFPNRLRMARICRDIQQKVSLYLFTLAAINIGLAIVTTLCFWLAGIGDSALWGIAFGIFNFVPIIGPTIIIVAAGVIGLATAQTIPEALAPPLILLALNTVEANLVQPWLLSRRIIISPVAIFVTVASLVWMWGPLAAITAVPSLIFFHTIAMRVPSLRRIGLLLTTEDGGALSTRRKFALRRWPRAAQRVPQHSMSGSPPESS